MPIPDFLDRLFRRQAQALGWQWIPEANVVDGHNRPVAAEPAFATGDDYVVLRLAEMYLKTTRVLWREYYPVVHSFVAHGDPLAQRSIATVAGPWPAQGPRQRQPRPADRPRLPAGRAGGL